MFPDVVVELLRNPAPDSAPAPYLGLDLVICLLPAPAPAVALNRAHAKALARRRIPLDTWEMPNGDPVTVNNFCLICGFTQDRIGGVYIALPLCLLRLR